MRGNSQVVRVVVTASILIVSLAFMCVGAQAQVIYQQDPGPGSTSATISSTLNNFGNPPGFRTADNFTLAATGRIDQVRWWGESNSGGNDFTFTFYANAGGVPGAILHTTGGSLTSQVVNVGSGFDPVTVYTSALTSSFEATLGTTYWLSIFNQAPDASWLWLSANANSDGSRQGQNPGPPWGTVHPDRAFQLETIPEPAGAALAMLLSAIAVTNRPRARLTRLRRL